MSAAGNRFVDDLRKWIDREENGVDLGIEAPAREPYGIPVLGQPLRIGLIEGGDEVADGGHRRRLPRGEGPREAAFSSNWG